MVELINDDCLLAMKKMGDACIDLTVTSPPYDNIRAYKSSLNWTPDVWKEVLKQLYRITKDGGIVVWVVGDAMVNGSETGTSFRQALYAMECGFNLHDTMIYKKDGPPQNAKRYEQKFEYMFVFSKGAPNTFNGLRENSLNAGKSRKSNTMRGGHGHDSLTESWGKGVVQHTKLKGNVFEYNTGFNGSTMDRIAHKHPAIFPERLAEDHILTWSNEGDVVFDPFLGSGTTGKMALICNRDFIGIEKVEEYFEIAKVRVHMGRTIQNTKLDISEFFD